MYRTADGGRTWTAGKPFAFPSFTGADQREQPAEAFADLLHGWVADGTCLASTAKAPRRCD